MVHTASQRSLSKSRGRVRCTSIFPIQPTGQCLRSHGSEKSESISNPPLVCKATQPTCPPSPSGCSPPVNWGFGKRSQISANAKRHSCALGLARKRMPRRKAKVFSQIWPVSKLLSTLWLQRPPSSCLHQPDLAKLTKTGWYMIYLHPTNLPLHSHSN